MASPTTLVDIFNLGLTTIGAGTVNATTDNNKGARAMLSAYPILRRAELRRKPSWKFAIKMAQLSAEVTAPLFGMTYAYPLPADFLEMVPPFPHENFGDLDYQIQNGKIYSRFSAPLDIRYVADIETVSEWDPIFQEFFAAKLAFTVCDAVVQSNAKKELAFKTYQAALAEAKRANSFSAPPQEFPESSYLSVRR